MLPTCFCPPQTLSSYCSLKRLPSSLQPISFSSFYIIPHSPQGLNSHITHFLLLFLLLLLLLQLSCFLTVSIAISCGNSNCPDCKILNTGRLCPITFGGSILKWVQNMYWVEKLPCSAIGTLATSCPGVLLLALCPSLLFNTLHHNVFFPYDILSFLESLKLFDCYHLAQLLTLRTLTSNTLSLNASYVTHKVCDCWQITDLSEPLQMRITMVPTSQCCED